MIPDFKSLTERVCKHEGYEPKPYQCSEGGWTIGHGLTYITERESKDITAQRLSQLHIKYHDNQEWYADLPPKVKEVLIEMAFQMGYSGTLKFKKMIAAMKNKDWKCASDEMKDSKWYRQTPSRCKELADIVREHG